ncbi:apolipoprotein N-acyltransferase [Caenispirillum salinarum]|uniref:apolipoprotein N-acyltransferase n=1 Tax=Caenispirillum salinarum TaxID=859058 RepID=UPI00384B7FFA
MRLFDRLDRLKDRTAALTGWTRAGLAVLLGMLTTLALPPVHAMPVLLVTLPLLVWLIDGTKSWRGALGIGWLFGLGHFATGFYWIANALLIDAERFGWMIPFAVGGLGGLMAIFPAAAAALARLAGTSGPARVLTLAAAWGALEWVRGWFLTGFPWNPLASAWMPVDAVLQTTAFVGTYGLSLLTMLAFAALALVGDRPDPDRRPGLATIAAAWGVLAVAAGLGAVRLATADVAPADGPRLRIVQPHIPQIDKWKQDKRDDNLLRHVELSQQDGFAELDAVIWPETAAPFAVNLDHERRRLAAHAAPPGGVLLTGAPRMTPRGDAPFQVWNSLVALKPDGTILDTYDKMHLVPFGEYVPLRDVLPLEKVTPGSTDFSFGTGPRLMTLPGLPPAGPLICYEVIFPGQIVLDAANRPGWLLNVTNDGWYGISAGPFQHWATSRLRAVEEGLPLVRAANTGISGVVDAYGRVIAVQPLGTAGVVDAVLPPALAPTLYARGGNFIPLAGAAALAACAFWLRMRRRQFCDAA